MNGFEILKVSGARMVCEEGCREVMHLPRKLLEFHSGRSYILKHFHTPLNKPKSLTFN